MKKHTLFEIITKNLYQYFSPKAKVTHNARLIGKSGTKRRIDVLIEDQIGIHSLKIVVDCKHYSNKVDINDVGEVWDIVDDVRANLGVIVSNAGFTDGAVKRADELGRLRLCSLLDLENKEFSIELALPVICEVKAPRYQVSISSKSPKFAIASSDPAKMLIKNKNGRVSSVRNEFIDMWNNEKVSHETGEHSVDFSPEEWVFLGPRGEFRFDKLKVNYEVVKKFYLGMVPVIEGKGIVDIQEHAFKTRGFTMEKINFVDVQKNWEQFSSMEKIKVKPFIHLVVADYYEMPSISQNEGDNPDGE